MKVLLHGWGNSHYLYEGLVSNVGSDNVLTYLPERFIRRYGDHSDTTDSSEIMTELDSFDIILFTPRSFYDSNFKKILSHNSSSIKAFVDFEDDFFIRNIYKNPNIKFYFKRELLSKHIKPLYTAKWYARFLYGTLLLPPVHRKIGIPVDTIDFMPYRIALMDQKHNKLRPFPLTVRIEDQPLVQRKKNADIDLFYCLTINTIRERQLYFKNLMSFTGSVPGIHSFIKPGKVPKEEYIDALTRAKASVSIRGMGFDTDRYWEIPRFGSALFSQRIPIVIENDFKEGESAVFFDSFNDFKDKFKRYVMDSNEWEEIARNGTKQYERFHTPKSRVRDSLLSKMGK